jgi:cyclopropane fatty-acyl-phospholipid synthase-like methyltransferase
MGLNLQTIKAFWDKRAKQYEKKKSYSITNLEEDEQLQQLKVELEQEHIFKLLKIKTNMSILDLGAGIGAWSMLFASKCKEVVAVEYSAKMIEIAKQIAKRESINNIEFVCQDVLDYCTTQKFDVIFISGLLIYIPDSEIPRLLQNMSDYSKKGTYLLVRDSTGIEGRYEIVNKYSEALKVDYSALYRTRDEYIEMFRKIGFELVVDEDMFEKGCPLNKWKETRLRVYLFEHI